MKDIYHHLTCQIGSDTKLIKTERASQYSNQLGISDTTSLLNYNENNIWQCLERILDL